MGRGPGSCCIFWKKHDKTWHDPTRQSMLHIAKLGLGTMVRPSTTASGPGTDLDIVLSFSAQPGTIQSGHDVGPAQPTAIFSPEYKHCYFHVKVASVPEEQRRFIAGSGCGGGALARLIKQPGCWAKLVCALAHVSRCHLLTYSFKKLGLTVYGGALENSRQIF